MVEEGTEFWKNRIQEQYEKKLQEQTETRELAESYKPWGKPGAGAPTDNVRKTKFLHQDAEIQNNQGGLTLGKPGYGAPLRTKSGRLRTHLCCDPDLGFQSVQQSQRTVDNSLRYRLPVEEKQIYRKDLERMIAIRKKQSQVEKAEEQAVQEEESDPWGKPGPGGRPWRRTKQLPEESLYQLLGWDAEQRKALEEGRRMSQIHAEREIKIPAFQSSEGIELVPLLQSKKVGRPRRDSNTGELLPNNLSRSDVTLAGKSHARLDPEHRVQYRQEISSHMQLQENEKKKIRELEQESSKKHFETWESFWGRPGHGAPCGGHVQREKLFDILHQQHILPRNTLENSSNS